MVNYELTPPTSLTLATPSPATALTPSEKLVETIVEAADERKADNIAVLKISDVSYLADYFIMATGFSHIQVRAIAEAIEKKVAQTWGKIPLRTEGKREGKWAVLDYGDVIVHLFLPQEREFYNLEAFWGHAQAIPVSQFTPGSEGKG